MIHSMAIYAERNTYVAYVRAWLCRSRTPAAPVLPSPCLLPPCGPSSLPITSTCTCPHWAMASGGNGKRHPTQQCTGSMRLTRGMFGLQHAQLRQLIFCGCKHALTRMQTCPHQLQVGAVLLGFPHAHVPGDARSARSIVDRNQALPAGRGPMSARTAYKHNSMRCGEQAV